MALLGELTVQDVVLVSIFLKDPDHFSMIWIQIRIEIFAWIRICKKTLRIRNIGNNYEQAPRYIFP